MEPRTRCHRTCQPPSLRKMEERGGEKDGGERGASTRDKNETLQRLSLRLSPWLMRLGHPCNCLQKGGNYRWCYSMGSVRPSQKGTTSWYLYIVTWNIGLVSLISEQKFRFCRVIKPNLCFCVFSMGGCGSGFRARFHLCSSLCSNSSKFTTQIPTQKTNLLTVVRSKQGNAE